MSRLIGVAAIVVALLLVHVPECAEATGTWTFSTCPSDVVSFFEQIFPLYGARRRLQADGDEGLTSFDQSILMRTRAMGSTSKPSSGSSLRDPVAQGDTLKGASSKFNFDKEGTYIPHPDAWDLARMAAAGCTSCTNGCCDETDITLDCGTMSAPLDYPDNSTLINLFVYRVRLTRPSLLPSNRTHLWVLQGGPGGSGLSILPLAVPSLQFATDIYVPDHRGTGFSTGLECPTQQSASSPGKNEILTTEVSACIDSGQSFIGFNFTMFTVTNAARDLALMITDAKANDNPAAVYVHGYSYGTRWAQRFLQIFPDLADKVVLEGIVAKDTVFNDFATGSQSAGLRFMEKCVANSICNQYFTTTSLTAQINSIVADGDNNPCTFVWSNSASAADVTYSLQILLYFGLQNGIDGPFKDIPGFTNQELFLDWRTFALSLVSRWVRCRDSAANFRAFSAGIAYFLSLQGGLTGQLSPDFDVRPTASITQQDLSNDIVYGIIAYSELWRYPTEDTLTYSVNNVGVQWGVVDPYTVYKAYADAWEDVSYSPDAFVGDAPLNVSSQLLLINGEIDGQTPRALTYQTNSDITLSELGNKTLAVINDQGHYATGFGCGLNVVKSFYNDASINTSCAITSEASPIRPLETGFSIASPISSVLVGSSNLWENQDVANYCQSPPTGQAGQDYCLRCFDYCIFLTVTGEKSNCQCAADLATCFANADFNRPKDSCLIVTNIYGNTYTNFADYRFGGKCYDACSGLFFGLSGTFVGLIAAGCFAFFLFIAVSVYIYRRSRTSQGGSILSGPTNNGTVGVPVATVVVHQSLAVNNPTAAPYAGGKGGVVISSGPVN